MHCADGEEVARQFYFWRKKRESRSQRFSRAMMTMTSLHMVLIGHIAKETTQNDDFVLKSAWPAAVEISKKKFCN